MELNLEIAQYVHKHPLQDKSEELKRQYLNLMEYFVRAYPSGGQWAQSTLELYKNVLLSSPEKYVYERLPRDILKLGSKLKKQWSHFDYRFFILFDCLFINAVNNREKGRRICEKISSLYGEKYRPKMKRLFEEFYSQKPVKTKSGQLNFMLDCMMKNNRFLKRKQYVIMITANMSAGKSTLINAITGKKVNKVQNDSCTAQIHYILNKAYEDGFEYEWDYDLCLDAGDAELMDDNELNDTGEIYVGARFFSVNDMNGRICIVDTPGVNSSQDADHRKMTEKALKNLKADKLVMLLNGQNIGTDDERSYLEYVRKNYKGDIIFVINKLDSFDANYDSVKTTIEKTRDDLVKIGFKDPLICPISAYAGFLAKRSMRGEKLNMLEQGEQTILSMKLADPKFSFNSYFPDYIQEQIPKPENELQELLLHSGIWPLETLLYNFE